MRYKRFVIKDKELDKYICFGEMDMFEVEDIIDATLFPETDNSAEWVEQYNEFAGNEVAEVVYLEIEIKLKEENGTGS